MGEGFNGALGCDNFSAYREYMRECDVLVQFCMAHLIRDVKFLLTLPGREVQAYGQGAQRMGSKFLVVHAIGSQVPDARISMDRDPKV